MSEVAKVAVLDDFRKGESLWKQTVFASLTVFLALLIGVISYYWFVYSRYNITTDDAFVDSELSPVNSRMMGFVKQTFVSENEMVKKGQVLAQFDDTDIKVEYGFKKAKLDKATADVKRATDLVRAHALSISDFELAKTNLIAMKADFEGTLLKLKYTHIFSPIDGIIGKKNVQAGQFIQPGQGLFVVVPEQTNWIKANYKETQLETVRAGMRVKITVDGYPHTTFVGHVESIAPTSGAKLSLLPPENASGNFTKIVQRIPVRIHVDSPRSSATPLRAGMSVSTTIVARP